MKIFTRSNVINEWIVRQRAEGKSIGFVPTMGALHEGHLSLIKASKAENDITVCSLFVNPSQFNDAVDLQKYPRNHDVDMAMLIAHGCDVTFLPTVMEVYPPGLETVVDVDLGGLDQALEGKFRPGHFDGMMEVVHRLLQITATQRLYMGQKDFQQQLIVKTMIEKLNMDVELIVCPIIREDDGLAMSSRNVRLSTETRSSGAQINKIIAAVADAKEKIALSDARASAHQSITEAGLKLEYLEVCDQNNLRVLQDWSDADTYVVVAAAWAGDVRLIDNMMF